MKLKCLPTDFQVEEQIALAPSSGPFALYRLTKQSLGTPEAVDAILRRWNLPRHNVAYAGLKDKHARTTQFVTIRGGPRRGLVQTNLELVYLGQAPRAVHAGDIQANRFVIVLRDLTADELAAARQALDRAAQTGLPNYFDEQRFGSLGLSGEFIARPWCLGDYERALWLALAEDNPHDRPPEREQKRLLREHWGQWAECKRLLARSHRRSIVTYLADKPGDFRRALALMRQDLRSLWLAAFQSHLWNQVLAALVRQVCRPEQLRTVAIGQRELPFFQTLDEQQLAQLRGARLPLPSARISLEGSPYQPLYEAALAAEGLELRQVRVKYPRDSFFSKGERAALFSPGESMASPSDDELYRGRQKLTLAFTLPRASYATILVKQIADGGLQITD